MQDDLTGYIQNNFPDFWNDINIRFELGEPFENGTDERINQVIKRVMAIFEEIFSEQDVIHLYIKDWGDDADMTLGRTDSDHLYDLLCHHNIDDNIMYLHDETMGSYIVKTMNGRISSIPYKDILIGIANFEQGRQPSIGQQVYFISIIKGVIFYMYDDRGCVIFADDKEKLRSLYVKYNDWLADYWRDYFDGLYK